MTFVEIIWLFCICTPLMSALVGYLLSGFLLDRRYLHNISLRLDHWNPDEPPDAENIIYPSTQQHRIREPPWDPCALAFSFRDPCQTWVGPHRRRLVDSSILLDGCGPFLKRSAR